jgi:PAS domain S-box-containing protein
MTTGFAYTPAALPENEAWRLQSLHDLKVLDSTPEAEFDALVKVASLVCGVPIALVSLVDADRQWFKADVGLGAQQTPRELAFCAHAILGEDVFEVPDALLDARFAGNPLVQQAPDIRFYAGAPIILDNGARVGTLCVIDRQPRQLTATQREVLQQLAVAASQALEVRKVLGSEKELAVMAAHDAAVQQAQATQRRLESALQEARTLADTIDIHAIVSESDRTGAITHCNDAFERISGYTRAELLGQNQRIVNSGHHPQSFWTDMWNTVSQGTPWRGDICNRAKDGRLNWVDSMIAPFIGNDGLVEKYVSIGTDITQRVQDQRRLDEMSTRMSLAIEGGNDGLWDWPDVHQAAQWWSPSYYAMLGYDDQELTPSSKSYLAILHSDCVAASSHANQQALAGMGSMDVEVQLRTKSAGYRWFRVRGKVGFDTQGRALRMAGSTQDVHDRKLAEAALVGNKALLDESQAVARVGGWELNLRSGALFWTDETYRIHETTPVLFDPTVDAGVSLFLPESRRIISAALKAATAHGQGYDLELQTHTTRGTLIDVRTTCAVTMEGGRAVKLSGIFQDITERKRYERELQAARADAEAATRSKGQFLANMSHEIRTPMNAILGLLNLLQNTELTARQRDYASKTEGAAQSLLGLLNDILDFSKVEAGKMVLESEPFRIDRVLRDLSVVLSANVGAKDVEVLFDLDTSLPAVVRGDAMRLQQVLLNLAGNAIKFTARGQVVLALRMRALTDDAVTIEFSVQDTGIGIAKEHQAHIFSGFSQAEGSTTRRFGGTGLGLAISKHLVEIMGGAIQITSTPGAGSTFSFVLQMPLVAVVPHELAMAQRPTLAPQRVLVVEDNPVAGELMLRMVRSWGWTADLAESGTRALELVSAPCADDPTRLPYSLIYMDWQLPDKDGWEATRHIRQWVQGSGLVQPVVIMVTAHGRETLAQRTVDEQDMLNGFLVKPVTASMLYDSVMDAGSDNSGLRMAAKGRSNARQLSGMRILVVEDNLINQQVADELLSAAGAIVSLAANGQIGVDAVAAAAPQFDVVLMDVQMPVLDGYGATAAIRGQLGLARLPIIAMTANAMDSDRDACMAAGMNAHVGKPFDMARLVALLVHMTGFQTQAEQAFAAPDGLARPLPEVAGLDLHTALGRMSGMRGLYMRTARDFVKIMDTIVPELQQCLASGDKQMAMMRLHTLKGNAGTLGAVDLAAQAAKLEALCKTGGGMRECELGLADFAILVKSTQRSLKEAIACLDQTPTRAAAPAADPLAHAATSAALRKIAALAAANDLEALQCFAEVREALCGLPADGLDRLDEALQNLDLQAAHALCQEMLCLM